MKTTEVVVNVRSDEVAVVLLRSEVRALVKVLEAVAKFEVDNNQHALRARIQKALTGFDHVALADAIAGHITDR